MEILKEIKKISQKEPVEFWIEIEEGFELEKRDRKEFLEEKYVDQNISVRYLNNEGKAGLSYSASFNLLDLEESVLKAKILSNYGVPSIFPEKEEKYPEVSFQQNLNISINEFKEKLNELEEKAFSFDSSISRVEKIKLSFGKIKYILIRNELELTWERPFCSFIISVIAKNKYKEASAYEWYEGVEFNYQTFLERVEIACKKALALSKTKKGKNLKVSILFPPFLAVELLKFLEFSFLGDEVLKGRSYLKDKLEKKVFNEKITLFDDGISPFLPESRPFDDEGVAQNKKILIEKGIVKTFLFDTYWKNFAEKKGFKEFKAGNSRRPNFSSFPKISSTNLYLKNGELSKEDLIKGEEEIFEALELLGGHTANSISGDFSFGVSGIYYKRGEPVDYFCEMALSGNIFELFKNVLELGSDITFYGATGSPSLLTEKMDLGG
uniref:TldD/PmbA family protein n=1 Tax=Thermodesulfobacterium geofontis TaxID=1295609 RepID=A0A7V6CE26_9BACT